MSFRPLNHSALCLFVIVSVRLYIHLALCPFGIFFCICDFVFVTLLPWERYLNWVPDPVPPPTRYHGDLTSPAPSENQENTPPQDASRKLPRRLRPRRRKGKQPGLLANENSASRTAGSVTQLGSPANRNSALPESSTATRPLPGNRPGISRSARSTPVEHPLTFLRPQHSQSPRFWTNQNAGRRFDPDHPEFQGVYKPAQPSIQQDSANRLRRDSFSGSGLPHLPFSDLIDTPSLNRPLGNWTKRYHWLLLTEKRGSLEVRGQESSTHYRTPLVLTRGWK